SPRHSPSGSPRTSITEENYLSPRPSSPCGKRRHSGADASAPSPSRTPSPLPSPRSLGLAEPAGRGGGGSCSPTGASPDLGPVPGAAVLDISESVPPKARRTSLDQASAGGGGGGGGGVGDERDSPCDSFQQHCAKKDLPPVLASPALHMAGDNFLAVPPLFSWKSSLPVAPCAPPPPPSTSLPSLDWQLPSAAGPYELRVDVQPKSHHRAHYETEGSRGAVKATTGGHPVVKPHSLVATEKPLNLQMFIGTADERLLRPHAFYQVHRITGKTVATPSQECVLTGTKVLEIPILPENGMTA
uniref:RHD domain-containing protein n=1 Tax=Petromyzon marinus TaxID=7757 RepID=S4R8L8_PETMA